jgi:hypothetical protein
MRVLYWLCTLSFKVKARRNYERSDAEDIPWGFQKQAKPETAVVARSGPAKPGRGYS